MDLKLKDKVIMVAAASKGMGYATALACAREGARVSIASPAERCRFGCPNWTSNQAARIAR